MSSQTYYSTDIDRQSNICDMQSSLRVNCTGIIDERGQFSLRYKREDYYFLYVVKGALHTHIGTLYAGNLVIFPPGEIYSYTGDENTSYYWVHFTGKDAGKLLRLADIEVLKIEKVGVVQMISDRFENLFYEFLINDSRSDVMKISLLREIIILSGRYKNGGSFRKAPFKSVAYINKNYFKRITVAELAEMEKMSLTSYRQVFAAQVKMSPYDYIIQKRISDACQQLAQSEKGISDIAAAVGYDDPYYFSRIFKKKMGVSPGQYRKMSRKS